jgi:DNA-binding NtrC family response regulator
VVIEIPPLRERKEDILPLASHLLEVHSGREGRPSPRLSDAVRLKLLGHSWPGNVRELESEMRRLVALGIEEVEVEHLAVSVRGRGPHLRRSRAPSEREGATLDETVEHAEREAIQNALRLWRGNKSRAAMELGITRKTLYRRMAKYGLER